MVFVSPEVMQQLAEGIWLSDPKTGKGFKSGRTHAKVISRTQGKSILELTVREGRNRQVRRVLAKLGHKVRDLTRVRMGPLTLHGLAVGEFRSLTPREVKALRKLGTQATSAAGKGEAADPVEGETAVKAPAKRAFIQRNPTPAVRPKPAKSASRPQLPPRRRSQ